MSPASIIACGFLILGGWLLFRWARKKDAEARRASVKKTEDEIEVEKAEILKEEQGRSDEEAWNEFNDRH